MRRLEATRELRSEVRHLRGPSDHVNYVWLADHQTSPSTMHDYALLPESLADFYSVVAQAHLPDVHYGFFVEPAESVLAGAGTVHPTKAVGAVEGDIVVVGTNGGDLIATTTDGRVYVTSGATDPWPVLNVDEAHIRNAFRDLAEFLEFLETQLRDAVADLR